MSVLVPGIAALSFLLDAGAVEPTADETLIASAVVGGGLLMLGLLQIPLGRRLGRWLGDPVTPSRQAFEWIDVLVVMLLFMFGSYSALAGFSLWQTGEFAVPTKEVLEALPGVEMLGLSALGQLPAALFLVGLAVRRRGGLAALGVRRLTPGLRLPYAVARYVVGLPMIYGLGLLAYVIYALAGQELGDQEAALMVADGLKDHPVPVILLTAVAIPLLEEILFRGFLLELLVARGGRAFGILGSSAAFALMHGFEAFLPIFGLAVILAIVKLRTRSLGAVWLVHGIHNGVSVLVLMQTTST